LLNILIFEMLDVIQVTNAVHAHGSFIFLQLWALGRATDAGILKRDDLSFDVISPWEVPITGSEAVPQPLTSPQVREYMQ
jgi:NADPH2 dehydrogenase